MDYLTFRGTGVREALLHVRAALGTKALIESTRHIMSDHGGGVGGRHTDNGRELLQVMSDEPSQSRAPADPTRALLAAAGFEGPLAHAPGIGATRAAGLIETPRRRPFAGVGPTGVGETTTLAKLAERAVVSINGACAWSA